ncbi:hypothetical protein PLESTF_001924800 [Pleodorina starrii]|nr:hypothetical protein PLESTF_001924800 [Pleodorina starrii]
MEESAEPSAALCQLPELDSVYEQYGGREAEAQELSQWLQKPGSRVAAVVADGGMGKTCLAVDVAWRLWRCRAASAGALYVDCRAAFSREALVMRLRAAAGLSGGDQGGMEALAAALGKMCSSDKLGGCLLVVLDNAEDPAAADGGAALAEILAQLVMASARLQLLVTSRVEVAVQHMPPPHTHRLQPLSAAVAGPLVQQIAKGVLTGEEARAVATACGCVPLVLRLVSEALVAGRLALEDVQEAVAGRGGGAAEGEAAAAVAGSGEAAAGEQREVTVMFVDMVIRSLPAAMKKVAMQVAAFSGVLTAGSAAVVMGVGPSSEQEVRTQLAGLHRLSVVLQHGDDAFVMHTHVRDVARRLLAEEAPPPLRTAVRERFARYAVGLLARWQKLHEANALKLMATEVAAQWPDVEQLLADVAGEAAAAGARAAAAGGGAAAPECALTLRLVEATEAPAAESESESESESTGRERRLAFAAALLVRCEALMYTGEYVESEGLAARAVAQYEQLRGRDSVECAAALHLHASCLAGQGRGAEAVPLYREALAVRGAALGPHHKATTATITHLAMQLSMEGQHGEAEAMYRQVLEASQRTFGPSHNLTAQALSNLAGCLHELGKLTEAEALYRRALDVYRDTVGPQHRQVAFTLVGLAAVAREAGADLEAVEGLYREALEVCRTALGPRHPHSQMTLRSLQELLRERGKGQEAEELTI